MRILLISLMSLNLAGCAGSIVGDAIAGPEKLARQDDAYCSSIGAPAGSPNYYNCRQVAEQRRQNSHAVGAALAARGAEIATRPAAYPQQPQRMECYNNGLGTSMCESR